MMKSKTTAAPSIEEFKKILREKQLKTTPQRVSVHEAMLSLGHASADMVAEYISKKGGQSVTIASVYNILLSLSDLGIYHHRYSSNNKMYFDVNTFKHIHLYDTVSNSYKDLLDDELISLVESRLKEHRIRGYKIDDIDIQIICRPSRNCRIKQL